MKKEQTLKNIPENTNGKNWKQHKKITDETIQEGYTQAQLEEK